MKLTYKSLKNNRDQREHRILLEGTDVGTYKIRFWFDDDVNKFEDNAIGKSIEVMEINIFDEFKEKGIELAILEEIKKHNQPVWSIVPLKQIDEFKKLRFRSDPTVAGLKENMFMSVNNMKYKQIFKVRHFNKR